MRLLGKSIVFTLLLLMSVSLQAQDFDEEPTDPFAGVSESAGEPDDTVPPSGSTSARDLQETESEVDQLLSETQGSEEVSDIDSAPSQEPFSPVESTEDLPSSLTESQVGSSEMDSDTVRENFLGKSTPEPMVPESAPQLKPIAEKKKTVIKTRKAAATIKKSKGKTAKKALKAKTKNAAKKKIAKKISSKKKVATKKNAAKKRLPASRNRG